MQPNPAVTSCACCRRTFPGEQRLIAGSLDIVPVPDEQIFSADFFGNRVMQVAILAPHSQIAFSMNARVERLRSAPANAAGVRLDELGAQIAACRDVSADSPHHFTGASERVSISRDIAQYARAHTDTGASVADNVRALGEALHRDMTFDPEATSVDTPMEVAFAARRGVCRISPTS